MTVKKGLSVLLALVMLLCTGAVPNGGIALLRPTAAEIVESGKCGDNATYTLDADGLLTVTGTGEIYANVFCNRQDIITAVINEGITGFQCIWWDQKCLFRNCTALTKVTLPQSLTSIGDYAFLCCTRLTSVTLPQSLTSIGKYAFQDCNGLTDITLPQSLTSIGASAFRGCTELTVINLPQSLTSIGEYAFEGCSSLTDVTLPESLTSIERNVFENCTGLTVITLPQNLTSIGSSAFEGCTGLVSVDLPESLTSIEASAFEDCNKLTVLNLPQSLTSIQERAFYDCTGLSRVNITDLTAFCMIEFGNDANPLLSAGALYLNGKRVTDLAIPEGITEIKPYAFDGCLSLKSVSFPSSLKKGWGNAFRGCTNIAKVECGSIADWCGIVFANEDANPLTIAHSLYIDGAEVTEVTVPAGVTEIGFAQFNGANKITSVILPDGVTKIGAYAFSGCTALSAILLPEGLTTIGDHAFYDCDSLEGITLPEELTTIGNVAFSDCDSLEGILLPNSLLSIGEWAFYHCNRLKEITVPSKLTILESYVFGACYSLTTITIPTSVIKIRESAFYYTGLTDVYYRGTPEQWEEISIGPDNGRLLNAVIHYQDSFMVRYSANGGTGAPEAQYKKTNEALTLSSAKPNKTVTVSFDPCGGDVDTAAKLLNARFIEWNSKIDGTGDSYAPGGSYTKNEDVTLYAQWQNPAVGTLPVPEKEGYAFEGWYTYANEKVTENTIINSNLTLYANWVKNTFNTYTVAYHANGGIDAPAAQTKTEGAALRLSSAIPTKTFTVTLDPCGGSADMTEKALSARFTEWNSKIDGTGDAYAPGGSYTKDADVTLYAQWQNPAVGTLPVPEKDGYTFAGWYTAETGGEPVTESTVITADTTLYAHWTEITLDSYTVTYHANGGDNAPAAQTKTEGAALRLSSAIPTKTFTVTLDPCGGSADMTEKALNARFTEWNSTIDGTGDAYAPGGSYTKDTNVTLYAQWQNPTVGALPVPEKEGFTFEGWYTAETGGVIVTEDTVIDADAVLFARWSAAQESSEPHVELRLVTLPETEEPAVAIIAVNCFGTETVELQLTCSEGVSLKKDLAENPDAEDSKKSKNEYTSGFNPQSGMFVGYFYDSLLTREEYEATATEPLRDSFDPSQFILGLLPYEAASSGGDLWIRVTGKLKGTADVAVDDTLRLNATAPAGSHIVTYRNPSGSAPDPQVKPAGETIQISSEILKSYYCITFDADGGSVASTEKMISRVFTGWNTAEDGSGTAYAPGAPYAEDADVTLYAQWEDPAVGTLPVPTRGRDIFEGWFTADGEQITDASVLDRSLTLYARWTQTPPVYEEDHTYENAMGVVTVGDQAAFNGILINVNGETCVLTVGLQTIQAASDTNIYSETGYRFYNRSLGEHGLFVKYYHQELFTVFSFTDGVSAKDALPMDSIVTANTGDELLLYYTMPLSTNAAAAVPVKETSEAGEIYPTIGNVPVETLRLSTAPQGAENVNGALITKDGEPYGMVYAENGQCISLAAAARLLGLSPLMGDIDSDGFVTASDARMVLRRSVQLEVFTDRQTALGDMDNDGTITASDARLTLRTAVALEKQRRFGEPYEASSQSESPKPDTTKLMQDLTMIAPYDKPVGQHVMFMAGGKIFFYESVDLLSYKLMMFDPATGKVSFIAYTDWVLGENDTYLSSFHKPVNYKMQRYAESDEKVIFYGSASGYNYKLCQYDIASGKVSAIQNPNISTRQDYLRLTGTLLWSRSGVLDLNTGRYTEYTGMQNLWDLVIDPYQPGVCYLVERFSTVDIEHPNYTYYVLTKYNYTTDTYTVEAKLRYNDGDIIVLDGTIYYMTQPSMQEYRPVYAIKNGEMEMISEYPLYYDSQYSSIYAVKDKRIYYKAESPHENTIIVLENGKIAETIEFDEYKAYQYGTLNNIIGGTIWYRSNDSLKLYDFYTTGRILYTKDENLDQLNVILINGTIIGEDENYYYLYGSWSLKNTEYDPDKKAQRTGFWRVGKIGVWNWDDFYWQE